MAHVATDRMLRNRVRRLKGQVEAIEKTIAGGDCSRTLQLIAAARGAMGALMQEVLQGHLREHVGRGSTRSRAKAIQEIARAMRSYL